MVVVRAGTTGGYRFVPGALPCPVMRRPQPASGLVVVMSSLLVAFTVALPASAVTAPAAPDPAPVLSATSDKCTKWNGQYSPPTTIRVLRTWKTSPPAEVKGTVVKVDFDEYVATVMAAEWPEFYPLETLKAGAIATKQFAWYYILNPRGKTKWVDGQKICYDVEDSTADQWYKPETFGPGQDKWPAEGSRIRAAMNATWDVSLRKINWNTNISTFFLTGYRAGATGVACGADATGWKLFHNSTKQCGKDGLTYREILRKYLGPNLEIVTPGGEDVIGSKHGDARLMQLDGSARVPRVWTPGRTAPEPGSRVGISLERDSLVGYVSADMNGDGREDLLWLKSAGASTGRLKVALSDGTNYREGELWWTGDTGVPLAGARLRVGDFNADQREDVAIIGRGAGEGTRMVMLKRKAYGKTDKFADPVVWWDGAQEYGRINGLWTGDLTGDGRADLVVRQHPRSGGVLLKTGITVKGAPAGSKIQGYRVRWQDPDTAPAKVKTTVGDANRDGRDDVLMVRGGSGRAQFWRLQGQGMGGLKPVKIWTAPKNDPIPVKRTRPGISDIDFDGRTDFVLLTEDGTRTRVRTLKTRYDKLRPGPAWNVGLPWSKVRTY